MKVWIFWLLWFILCSPFFIKAQSVKQGQENIIWAKISVTLIVDITEETDYSHPGMQDLVKNFPSALSTININLLNCPLRIFGNRFQGSYRNSYYPYDSTWFDGTVSQDRMMLKELAISRRILYQDDRNEMSEILDVILQDLPMHNGICTFDKENSSISVPAYTSKKVTSSKHQTFRRTVIFREIDYGPILNHSGNWNFRIRINMEGPSSYLILIHDVRGEDTLWAPPVASLLNENVPEEPGSVGIYPDIYSQDPQEISLIRGTVSMLSANLSKTQGLKILERMNLQKILKEIELSQSGLIKEEPRVQSRLMKEEVSVILKMEFSREIQEFQMDCMITSRKGATRIQILNIDQKNLISASNALLNKVSEVVQKYCSQ